MAIIHARFPIPIRDFFSSGSCVGDGGTISALACSASCFSSGTGSIGNGASSGVSSVLGGAIRALICSSTPDISLASKVRKYSPSVFEANTWIREKSAASVRAMPKIRAFICLLSAVISFFNHWVSSRSLALLPVSTMPSVTKMIPFWAPARPLVFNSYRARSIPTGAFVN